MQKQAFKIMGALLVLVLAVSFSVGAVSAAQTDYTIPVTIPSNGLVLTKDVPPYVETSPGVWEQTEPIGDFTPATSVYGALRWAYANSVADSTGYYIASLDVDFYGNMVSEIDGNSGRNVEWRAFIGDAQTTNLAAAITSGQTVRFLLVDEEASTIATYTTLNTDDAEYSYSFPVTLTTGINDIWTGTVNLVEPNVTGLDAFKAAADSQPGFDYTVSGVDWLLSIDGVSKNYDKSGYGWGIFVNGTATSYTLSGFNVTDGQVLSIKMLPSSYAGNYAETPVDGYYQNHVSDSLAITARVSTA